jgi:hypothetical protein
MCRHSLTAGIHSTFRNFPQQVAKNREFRFTVHIQFRNFFFYISKFLTYTKVSFVLFQGHQKFSMTHVSELLFSCRFRSICGPISTTFNLTILFILLKFFNNMTATMTYYGVFWSVLIQGGAVNSGLKHFFFNI